ncbi:hypothetical protein LMG31506_01580 [Cupriavidus yeoncheonensis]|uniref:Uncharacterized protein n=1 Tax=Cupriavidus yeoncheonensis TaxID=1462994 RepID=A0A916IS59_9BURK|nr:hypothetical protein [Cupriavidus yeoncheonensis]CAG2135591.1 hypothetical protein LMG31506_01580 [Cupriavidus yeoncheonensis]
MAEWLDWLTAIGAAVVVYAALRYPIYPPGFYDDEPARTKARQSH